RTIHGTSIAHNHMYYTQEVRDGVLHREQTGELNRDANLTVLFPENLVPGTRIIAQPLRQYQGQRYVEYGGEYRAEDVDENFMTVDGKFDPERYGSVPIQLIDESTKTPVGFLHDRGWLLDSVGGNGFSKQYRNVDVLENYEPDQWEDLAEAGLKSIDTLESE